MRDKVDPLRAIPATLILASTGDHEPSSDDDEHDTDSGRYAIAVLGVDTHMQIAGADELLPWRSNVQ